jgi:protein-tyrosine phosphatase
MIDIHTHILPGLDDGPENEEESIMLARSAVENGTHTIVATPHVLNGLDMNRNIQIAANFNRFRRKLKREIPELTLVLGSEIYFRPRLADLAYLEVATIGGAGRYMLVEFSLGDIPKGFDRELKNLRKEGIIPIVAHPERNAAVLRRPSLIGQMVSCGALIQINAGSITGSFGKQVKKLAHNLLKRGWVHVIASDAHSAFQRGPGLEAAVSAAEEILGAAKSRRLVNDHPGIIVEGLPWIEGETLEYTIGGMR